MGGEGGNRMLLELVKGLLEAHDRKTLKPYLQKPTVEVEVEAAEEESPEIPPEDMAALEMAGEDDDEMEA